MELQETRMMVFWNKVRDVSYKIRLFIGFNFFGWFQPIDADYGFFIKKKVAILKKRSENRVMTTRVIYCNRNGVTVQ